MKEFIDLGLPSGKLWATENEEGYFTFDEAVEKFQEQLPTIEDWQELIENTKLRFDKRRKGLVLKAHNGKELYLPAMGYRSGMRLYYAKSVGNYWSATILEYDHFYANNLYFGSLCAGVSDFACDCSLSVRLIKAK